MRPHIPASIRAAAALFLLACLCLSGCGDSAESLFNIADLEEKQHNPGHALKLYKQIVEEHPDSPCAAQAKERIRAIGSGAKPAAPGS
jgi:TolA-binding protein